MQAGKLRNRIELLKPVITGSGSGPVTAYKHVDWIWASVNIKSGKEAVADQAVRSSLTYEIIIRHREDIASDWQIKHRGMTLDIVAAFDPEQRRRELHIQAVKHG